MKPLGTGRLGAVVTDSGQLFARAHARQTDDDFWTRREVTVMGII